jgi:hypothetical protein
VKGFVIWVDDDRTLIIPEMFDLEVLEYETKLFSLPSTALDWISANHEAALQARAIVVDALLPRCSDPRFTVDMKKPAGLVLCELLEGLPIWPDLRKRITLYTRTPPGEKLDRIKQLAKALELEVLPKSVTGRIALWLKVNNKLDS